VVRWWLTILIGGSMSKYIFKSIKDPDNKFDTTQVTFEIETSNRSDLIEEFIRFLNACGYGTKDLEEDFEIHG
jgi:hypothetical protein